MDNLSIFLSPDMLRNRYPLFAQMRSMQPVMNIPDYRLWLVFRYDEVRTALSDHANFSSDFSNFGTRQDSQTTTMDPARVFGKSMIGTDPPIHRKLRDLATRAFTPKAVDNLEPGIITLAHQMLDDVIEKGHMDLIHDLAAPLPVIVIAQMLGVPPEDQRDFKRWSDLIAGGAENFFVGLSDDSPEANLRSDASRRMHEYCHDIIQKRRVQPADDMISALIAAEVGGEKLDERDLMAFCTLLLIAGNITTTNLIGHAILSFLENPSELARLRAEPSLLPSAIEEVLRYQSPAQCMFRSVINEVELGGQTLHPGDRVLAWIGSANRDETKFEEPDRFNISRQPNPHIAFGFGVHYCLGAPLARLESRIALTAILERLQNIERSNDDPLEPVKGLLLNGLASLPIQFTPAERRENVALRTW